MKVYVVYSEFNRGADLDGGASIEGVWQHNSDALKHAIEVADGYRRELGLVVYDEEEDDPDWDVDVHVEEAEVL